MFKPSKIFMFGFYIYSKRHNFSFTKLCDVGSVGLALGQAIGRWGNFFNSEAYGSPTNLPWKLYIAPQYRTVPYLDNAFFHPTFLYESLLDFILFLILLTLIKKNIFLKEGNITLIYLLIYSAIRICVETLRIDSIRYVYGIPVAILVSISIIFISIILLILNNKKSCSNVIK